MVAASTVVSTKDRLPLCELILKLLYCTERFLDKYFIQCLKYIATRYPYKMQNYHEIIISAIGCYRKTKPKFHNQQITAISTASPITLAKSTNQNIHRQSIKKSTMLVEPNPLFQKLFESPEAPTFQNHCEHIYLNQQYPITEVSDFNLPSYYDVENSRPPYSLCLPRKLVDEQFLICCQQYVPSNFYSLCTYEHRKHIAVETLIQTIQQDASDPKYLNSILYCANRNRDNCNCCCFLGCYHRN